MKNNPVVIINGDPKSTFNEILIKTLKLQIMAQILLELFYKLYLSFLMYRRILPPVKNSLKLRE